MAPHGNNMRDSNEQQQQQQVDQPQTATAASPTTATNAPAEPSTAIPAPKVSLIHSRYAHLVDGTHKRRRAVSGQLSRRERKWELLLSKVPRATTNYESEPFVFRVRDYLVIERLGAGSGGRVYLSKHEKTDQRVAIKVIEKVDARKERKARKEAGVMRALGEHRHVVPLIDVIENEGSVCIVMGHASGGDLFEYIGRHGAMEPKEAWRIFGQIVSAVAYAHSRGFIHRDVKPENIFLDADNNAMLGDWGYASAWSSWKKKRRPCGSLNYAASEIVSNKTYTGPEVDIFSLGGVLYTMLTGRLPFGSQVNKATLQRVVAGQWRVDSALPNVVVDFLHRMFEPVSIRRATMMEVLQFVRTMQREFGVEPTSPRSLRTFADCNTAASAGAPPNNNSDILTASSSDDDTSSSSSSRSSSDEDQNGSVEEMRIDDDAVPPRETAVLAGRPSDACRREAVLDVTTNNDNANANDMTLLRSDAIEADEIAGTACCVVAACE